MSIYLELRFAPVSQEASDLLIARLSELGFEGFEEENQVLKAFIPKNDFLVRAVDDVAGSLGVRYTTTDIPQVNWNAQWESSFSPVLVDDFVAIRADFHEANGVVEHEIIITPKMSFGTGHHATTYMMVEAMRKIDFSGKQVFDFGTGTGVLGILAEKLGAERIIAIDNDEWSIDNTVENLARNGCSRVQAVLADSIPTGENFDIILANINKNVILANLKSLTQHLNSVGVILLSGLLLEDAADILAAAKEEDLKLIFSSTKNNWLLIKLSR